MALYEGWKGIATIKRAFFTKAESGTRGICMGYATDDGSIDHTWYMTPNTADRLAENLEKCFGIKRAQLNAAFLERIGEVLVGKMCRLTIKGEDYKGKRRLVVEWMNPVGGIMEEEDFSWVASLFGADDDGSGQQPSEDDSPF
jgi:hypothetical protein